MHFIEPHYAWRHLYIASEDDRSPFFGREYSEFEFTHAIYDYCIHPQWDDIGSSTLFIKIIYASYHQGFCIMEMMGEWNDLLHNDIMYLKRNIAEPLIENGIHKFILVGENILNFHAAEDDYYQEWSEELEEDGWIIGINFRDHVVREFAQANLDHYIAFGGRFDSFPWRSLDPGQFFEKMDEMITRRLNP
ncbi:MAG: hypothetical protein R6T99_11115 [Bacteroidales bacterium]